MRKWLKRGVMGVVVLVAFVLMGGLVYEQWSRWSVVRTLSPEGELVEVDGRRVHLRCLGERSPTVILEAGLGPGGWRDWASLMPEIAPVTRVCAYDRAGILWSDRGEEPRDAHRIADELHTLLAAASESPPYVLVGHSLGGLLVRVFADRYPGEVSGFVFVDASHPQQMERAPPEVAKAMAEAMPKPLLMKTLAATGALRLGSRLSSDDSNEQATDVTSLLLPRTVPGLLAEIDAIEDIASQAAQTQSFGELPIVVLTAGRLPDPLPPGVDEDIAARMQEVWLVLQSELATLSSNVDHRVIEEASHYIHYDDPDAVLTAIADVVTAARQGSPVRRVGEEATGKPR